MAPDVAWYPWPDFHLGERALSVRRAQIGSSHEVETSLHPGGPHVTTPGQLTISPRPDDPHFSTQGLRDLVKLRFTPATR